jgi:hypothetical protein
MYFWFTVHECFPFRGKRRKTCCLGLELGFALTSTESNDKCTKRSKHDFGGHVWFCVFYLVQFHQSKWFCAPFMACGSHNTILGDELEVGRTVVVRATDTLHNKESSRLRKCVHELHYRFVVLARNGTGHV